MTFHWSGVYIGQFQMDFYNNLLFNLLCLVGKTNKKAPSRDNEKYWKASRTMFKTFQEVFVKSCFLVNSLVCQTHALKNLNIHNKSYLFPALFFVVPLWKRNIVTISSCSSPTELCYCDVTDCVTRKCAPCIQCLISFFLAICLFSKVKQNNLNQCNVNSWPFLWIWLTNCVTL